MNSAFTGLRAPALARLAIAVISLFAILVFAAPQSQAAPVTADTVLLETADSPWDDVFNPEAMAAAFGSNWERQTFAAVQADAGAGGLFAPHVRFIWIEGSDESTEAADKFVEDHEASLKAFVARGGGLFINNATNEEIIIDYDGRALGRTVGSDSTDTVAAALPTHPIFNGPATPNAIGFTGGSFAHGRVTGPGLTPLIVSTEDDAVVLAEYGSGSGRVALGTMTAVEFQDPEDAAKALRINLLHYLLGIPGPSAPPAPAPPTPLADTKKPKVKIGGVPKGCLDGVLRLRVSVSDEGGVGTVRIKLDGKLLRKADGKGKTSRVVKATVPESKLDRPGRHRIKVIARDSSGNVKRQGAGFKVCE